jgi:hypothetical protein
MSDGENATPGRAGDAAVPGTSGHHTEGVAVADVLAKVTGSSRLAPVTRHRAGSPGADSPGANSPSADSDCKRLPRCYGIVLFHITTSAAVVSS